jgi:hypothetical protein
MSEHSIDESNRCLLATSAFDNDLLLFFDDRLHLCCHSCV